MFTGLISDIGTIRACDDSGRVTIGCGYDSAGLAIGASIACSGVCLSVVAKGKGGAGNGADSDACGAGADSHSDWFAVDISPETRARTASDMWQVGRRLNLERSLRVGDELGGHIVTGHVDDIGTIRTIEEQAGSRALTIAAPLSLAWAIAPKGSIAVDGVSLTVNQVIDPPHSDDSVDLVLFAVTIIPHTQTMTTLGMARENQSVNLEIDILARYVQRMAMIRSNNETL